jgi:hypothetical protein
VHLSALTQGNLAGVRGCGDGTGVKMSCISGSLQVPIVDLRNPFLMITGRSQGFVCFMGNG